MNRRLLALVVILPPIWQATRAQDVVTFSSRVDTVRVDVLVSTGRQPVVGLTQADFEVLDNGVPQAVNLVALSELSLNVVLALDTSNSVTGERLAQLTRAGQAIVDRLKDGDQLALLTFATGVTIRMPLTSTTRSPRSIFLQETASGNTALNDAVYSSLVIGETASGRALVIVFSDGRDTSSFLSATDVTNAARKGNEVVYAVATRSGSESSFLSDVTRLTGGRVLAIDASTNIDATFGRILDEFRQRYVLSYTPDRVPERGWHKLEVRVKNRAADVNARPGYFAGSD